MGPKVKPAAHKAAISLDKRLYRREAVTLAAAVFAQRAEFFVEKEDAKSLRISLAAKNQVSPGELRGLAGEFLNEALNQDLRLDLAKQNSRILELLTAQALISAGGAEKIPLEAKAEKNLQAEAGRYMAEAKLDADTEAK
jgi:His-Xaa-Ser system protein HxsD